MTTVICPCAECKHNGEKYVCRCKTVKLKYRNMLTANEGRVDMWVCDRYELAPETKLMMEDLKRIMQKHRKGGAE